MSLLRFAIRNLSLFAVVMFLLTLLATDATAGPLSRLRARRQGSCTAATGTVFRPAASGCASGACSLK